MFSQPLFFLSIIDAILGRCAALQDIRLLRRMSKPVPCIPPNANIGPASALFVEKLFPGLDRIFRRKKLSDISQAKREIR
ncbi:hypothetical protein [Acidithiobacillus ferrooxidans]|uniref:hypothetical protein n=1 Tax=Acidithiobacillus ferrooxidans TaxID=920 RepID=UPI001C06D53C|nr:hypothetical protein [Acidithiobacillus ferrooxidans]